MKIYDVLVIGGGVTGAAAARELSKYDLKIALLEKEEELAFGVSKSNSGIIHPGTQNPPGSLKGRLCVEGNRLVRETCRELGVEFKEVGELIVAFSREEEANLRKLKKEGDEIGVPSLKIVGPGWLRKNEPNLNKKALCALYAPTAGIISPYRLVYDLSENAAANGVEIHTLAEVKSIIGIDKNEFEVRTAKDTYRTRYVVNAAGLFADKIAAMAGIDDIKIFPRKGEEYLLDKKKENISNHLLFPLPSKRSKGILVIKTSDGNPMIGPTAEDTDDKELLATTDTGFEKVLAGAKKLIPAINAGDIIAYFAGLRPVSGGDFLIRHEDAVPGFVNVAGIQSPGLTSAPAIAVMVADILKRHGLGLKKKLFFRRHRKKTHHLFNIPLSKTEKLIKKDPAYGDIVCRCEMVSRKEVEEAIGRGARTLEGIMFRTRAQAGRCHGGFCTTRLLKILSEKTGRTVTEITKRGQGSEIVKKDRCDV